jgi:tRNA(fMet)-specific endonuclease VapC
MGLKYLLDTNTAQSYIQSNERVAQRANEVSLRGARVGISIIVFSELLAAIENSHSRDRNMAKLDQGMKSLALWPYDEAAAFLKRIGKPIDELDVMIAGTAMMLSNCVLVTIDSDFQNIPDLRIENWML